MTLSATPLNPVAECNSGSRCHTFGVRLKKNCDIAMAFHATVCNVMIASPGDVQIERNIVREVVHDWNAVNASTRRAVLLPVGWETHSTPLLGDRPQAIINWQVLKDSDLLIAAFWTRIGTPTGKSPSGTIEEIEEHLRAGKPALLYFSAAPVSPDSVDPDQYKALSEFKGQCKSRGLYETYDSTSDFHDRIRRHLAMTMNTHPYFLSLLESNPAPGNGLLASPVPSLSREATLLLIEAIAGGGDVMVIAWMDGSAVQANGKNFVEQNNPRSRAIWEGAVEELLKEDFLQPVGRKGEVFRVTRKGYDAAELLKS